MKNGVQQAEFEYFRISTVENKYNSNTLPEFQAISFSAHNMRGLGLIPH
jgi:hypothetical protein